MKLFYDKYNRPVAPKIFLGTPNNQIICQLDGIDASSFNYTPNLTNTHEISFDVNRKYAYKNIDGKTIEKESNAFKLIGLFLRIYVEGFGWFIIDPPDSNNDGTKEKYSITAQSAEIEFQQHNIINLKTNQGTTDSYEMLVDGNVEMIGDVEFAKEQIKFYNPKNPELSFLDIVLKVAGITGWTIGEIDSTPKTYKYFEDGEQKEKQTLLADEIGVFEVDSQDTYSFLTQDAAKFFNCIFVFDFEHFKINAYRPENYGRKTNVNINFKNFQNSLDISVDDSSIYTRYYVQGADDLGIQYVNFGSNYIENIDYYLNEKYLKDTTIEKYKLWKQDVEIYRNSYIENTRLYNEQYTKISELTNRVPLDDCSTDWSTFSDDKLLEARANYQAQQKGYEAYYVDDDGNFDEEALKNSVDANDYYQIRDVILPSIQIEIDNRNLPSGVDEKEYIDTYKTDWKLYGLNELETNIQVYKNNIKLAEDEGCNVPYDDTSKKTKDYHDAMYKKYQEATEQLDGTNPESCISYYNKIKSQIDDLKALQDSYDEARKIIVKKVDKETWEHVDGDSAISFTQDDLDQLSHLYVDGAYTNENMFLVDSDDSVSAIDEQLKLLDAAKDDLYIASHPQYQFSTTVDNFLAMFDFKDYAQNLNIGDYLYLQIRDDYVEKLRVVSMEYNPLVYDNNLQITFSNMIRSTSSRDDIAYLLDNSGNSSKNSSASSSTSNRYTQNDGVSLSPSLIQKLVQSGAFADKITQIINNNFSSVIGGSIGIDELNAKMIKVSEITGENAFFEYLQTKFISTDKIVADSGTFKDLDTLVANIKKAIIGASYTETGIVINLTAENATMSEALIKDLIAKYITVNDLKAGNIITDTIKVMSENGRLQIVGDTLTIYDDNNTPVIQIGKDKNDNYGIVISDSKGAILLDSEGLHEGIVPDLFIKTDMIGNGQVTEDKIDKTNIHNWIDADGNKVFDVSKMYFGDDKFITSYQTIQNDIKNLKETSSSMTSNYNVILSNESQTIPCNSDGIVMESFIVEILFDVYKGLNMIPGTVTVTNLPSGITLGSITDSTDSKSGKILLNIEKGSDLGGVAQSTGQTLFTFSFKDGENTKTLVKKFTWTKVNSGEDAIIYSVEPSVNVLKKCTIETTYIVDENGNYLCDEKDNILYSYEYTDQISPETITFYAYSQKGNGDKVPFLCRFVIMESQNGISYSTKYTSDSDEVSVTYTPTTTDLHHIKCIICKPGGITDQIDSQTVLVIHDVESYDAVVKSFLDKFSSIALEIDNAEKSILQRATQQDVQNYINEYDQSTIKIIRDQQTEQKLEIGRISSTVSDVQAEVETKADGSTVTKLKEKVTKNEQTAEEWRVSAEKRYGTKDEISEVSVRADKIESRVSNNEENISKVTQTVNGISSTVSGLRVGGDNLIRNSNTLIFTVYRFYALLTDENGNVITDTDGSQIYAYY